jgi:predicted nucleic acid-binding protein
MSKPSTPEIVRAWMASLPAWFSVRTPSSPASVTELRHRGERDAICLAQEISANAILLDEERARTQAISLGITVIGTIGVLQRAADQGLISNLKSVHDALRRTDFRVSDKILHDSLARHLSARQSRRNPGTSS